MGAIQNILNFILVIGVLVFFHELGHFLFAKLFKMKVEEFALGMGPRAIRLGYDGETEYTIRWLPIGGFVRIKGMEVEDSVESRLTGAGGDDRRDDRHHSGFESTNHGTLEQEAEEVSGADPDGFNNRPIPQRFWVIFGGPLFSFLLGWLLLCSIGFTFGVPTKSTIRIGTVAPGSVAQQAGIRSGEVISAVNGKTAEDAGEVLKSIQQSPGKPLTLTLREGAATRELTVTPKPEQVGGDTVGRLGFGPKEVVLESKRVSLAESFQIGNANLGIWFHAIGQLFTSFSKAKESVGGPVAIFETTRLASELGGGTMMSLIGQLSLSLALFNLFPIPVLDGGHLTLMGLEAIRKRKLTAEQTNRVFTAGLALLLMLFVAVMYKDIMRLITRG